MESNSTVNIPVQPVLEQNQTVTLPNPQIDSPRKKSKLLILVISTLVILLTGIGFFIWKPSLFLSTIPLTQPVNTNERIRVFPNKNPPYVISKPSVNDIRTALVNAQFDLENGKTIQLPIDQLIQFVQPFFYPPNGYTYTSVKAMVVDYINENEKELDRSVRTNRAPKDGYITYYLRLSGVYESYSDTFIVGITYPFPSQNGLPEIRLNTPGFGIAPSLSRILHEYIFTIPQVKNFRDTYRMGGYDGQVLFYRSAYANDQNNHMKKFIVFEKLPTDKNIIQVRFLEPGGGIPENPRASITVYIDTEDYSVLKISNYSK